MSMSVQNQNSVLLALQTLKGTQGQDAAGPIARTSQDQPAPSGVAAPVAAALGGLAGVQFGLDRATSIADAGLAGADQIAGLLSNLHDLVAGGANADQARALVASMDRSAVAGGFDGVNLIDGSQAAALQVSATGGRDSDTVTLQPYDLSAKGLGLADLDLSDPAAALKAIEAAQAQVGEASEALSTQSKQLTLHGAIVGRLNDLLASGVEQGLSAEGARLQALQVRQVLQASGQSIANQSPSAILGLFRV